MSEPTTAAGRALGEALPRFFGAHAYWRDFKPSVNDRITAIENEAAAAARASLLDELDAWARGMRVTEDMFDAEAWNGAIDEFQLELIRRRP